MKMVREFEERSAAVGYQSLITEALRYSESLGLTLRLAPQLARMVMPMVIVQSLWQAYEVCATCKLFVQPSAFMMTNSGHECVHFPFRVLLN